MTLNFKTNHDQKYFCDWRKTERTMRFGGRCACCGKRVYYFLDGENDPRGPLGDHAMSNLVASEYGAEGPDVIACFNCHNDERSYKRLLQITDKKWKRK